MDAMALKKAIYTYADYLKWDDDERWEIIEGIIYNMSPAPTTNHQRISRNLVTKFDVYLEGKTCEVFDAPFDVRLPKKEETKKNSSNVVQPDIVVICDPAKIDEAGCFGSPDLIIEILSPSTSKKDKTIKFKLYEEHGVREYWLIDPFHQTIDRFHLNNGEYGKPEYFHLEDTISPIIFPDFKIKLEDVFPVIKKVE